MKKFLVHTVPNSRANDIKQIAENVLKVKVAAPPIDGRANKELIKILAKHFKVHKKDILILHGATSKEKIIGVEENG